MTGVSIVWDLERSRALVVVTDDLPDEARLALLDLDVTAPELRGKLLRWDEAAGEWRPPQRGGGREPAPGDTPAGSGTPSRLPACRTICTTSRHPQRP